MRLGIRDEKRYRSRFLCFDERVKDDQAPSSFSSFPLLVLFSPFFLSLWLIWGLWVLFTSTNNEKNGKKIRGFGRKVLL